MYESLFDEFSLLRSLYQTRSNTTSRNVSRKEVFFVLCGTTVSAKPDIRVTLDSEYFLVQEDKVRPSFLLNRISVLMGGYSAVLTVRIPSHDLSLRPSYAELFFFLKNTHFLASPWSALYPYSIASLSLQSLSNVLKLEGIHPS